MKLLTFCLPALVACSPRHLPPPAPPAAIAPELPPLPQVEGQGQVTLDTVDGPSAVIEVLASEVVTGTHGIAAYGEQTKPICTTPCVVNLTYGTHELRFVDRADGNRRSTEWIPVTATPTVHRYAVGRTKYSTNGTLGGIMLASIGGVTGLTGLLVGAGTGSEPVIGIGIGGVIAMLGGFALMSSNRPELQRGSLTSFPARAAER